MEKVYGRTVATFFTAAILWTAFGSVFALLLGYSRIPYAAAKDGYFFKAFARLHPKGAFPSHFAARCRRRLHRLQLLLAWHGDRRADHHADPGAVHRADRRADAAPAAQAAEPGAYRMWLYPLPSLVALAGWIFVFATSDASVILFGLGTLLVGVAAFGLWSWRRKEWPF